MRKYLAQNCRRRPNLDPLESRYLLSGGIEVIEVHPVPALIVGIDFRQTPHPADVFGSLPISPVSSGPGDWSMPGFHHDFSPPGEMSLPAAEFHTYSDLQVVSPLISPNSESDNAPVSTPISESMAAVPAYSSHGVIPPGSPAPPFQPPLYLFLSGDPGRFLHAARDLVTRPLTDEMTMGSQQDTAQDDEVTISPASNQTAVLAQAGNSIGQIAPSVVASTAHLTSLFNPEPGRDDQSIRTAWSGESPGNQPVEAAQGNVPNSGPAILVTTDGSSAADGVALRGDDNPVSVGDPLLSGSQTKLLLPQAAGLIASAVPFDRAALEKAVDRFFDQLEDLGMGQLVEPGPTHVIPLSLALLSTVTAVEVARRRLRSRTGETKATERQNPLGSEELLGFPELPGSWSTNPT
jgi:hypothetical protein